MTCLCAWCLRIKSWNTNMEFTAGVSCVLLFSWDRISLLNLELGCWPASPAGSPASICWQCWHYWVSRPQGLFMWLLWVWTQVLMLLNKCSYILSYLHRPPIPGTFLCSEATLVTDVSIALICFLVDWLGWFSDFHLLSTFAFSALSCEIRAISQDHTLVRILGLPKPPEKTLRNITEST